MNAMTAQQRTAPNGDRPVEGQVVLMNRFAVRPERDDAFHALWNATSQYFRKQPGFVSLRLHRAISSEADYRWVNVATWESEAHFRAAHASQEFRDVVTTPGWDEFPSSPMLFEVVTAVG
ncbi:MAG TPA: antibiotic biosynthesis monooxygenase family protein [Mycobacteriales bacterium]|jgi:heme-degrading monooxygenase HmoA|nr:antibiotic biosynthesis monooxygenase family protein [Mycobacteriales bacterium]